MPNRIIKESICVSDQIDELGWFGEVFFYRLLVNCDDYGCMDARPKILKAKLFPLKDVSQNEIVDTIINLVRNGLIRTYEVDGKPYLQVSKWAEHQRVRNSIRKYPTPDQSDVCDSSPQVAASCGELPQDDAERGKNPQDAESCGSRVRPRAGAESESESNPNPNPNPTRVRAREDDDDDLRKIQSEQNRVLDAAEDAGFKKSNSARAKLIDLYAVHGLEKVLAGIDSCVKHGAPNLAYLEACMRDPPKKSQGYEQRDYSGETDEAFNRMVERITKERA